MERVRTLMSIVTIGIAFSAWLAISNHCVLGATGPETARPVAAADECPFHAKHARPEKSKPESSGSPCCKILRATVVATANSVAQKFAELASVDVRFAELVVFAPPKITFRSPTLGTGPPGSGAVAQLIWSMRAHAPPVVA